MVFFLQILLIETIFILETSVTSTCKKFDAKVLLEVSFAFSPLKIDIENVEGTVIHILAGRTILKEP